MFPRPRWILLASLDPKVSLLDLAQDSKGAMAKAVSALVTGVGLTSGGILLHPRQSPPAEKKKSYESDFLLTLRVIFCKMSMF